MAKKQAKKTSKRGGARENAGRPRVKNARRCVLALRLSEDELSAVSARGGSRWARGVLLAALGR